MTFWPLTNSDFPADQTFQQFHYLDTELDLHRIMSVFHGAFATGVTCQQGNAYPSGHLFPSPFWELACAPIVETRFLDFAMSLLDFLPWIPLGTFSILIWYIVLLLNLPGTLLTLPNCSVPILLHTFVVYIQGTPRDTITFPAVVDGEFLTDRPENLFKSGKTEWRIISYFIRPGWGISFG